MATNKGKKSSVDPAQLLHRFLTLGQHLRLMCIVGCIGAMAGLIAYCYTTPVYYSRTVINWQVFGLPFHDDAEDKSVADSTMNLWRQIKLSLESESLLKDTAIQLGVAKAGDDIDSVRGVIRVCRLLYRDSKTLLVEVYATDPRVVRELPMALLECYDRNQAQTRRAYREKATEKYLTEAAELKKRIDEGLKSKLDFEKANQFATLTLKQERLMKLPADIERTKAQISRMEQIKSDFAKTKDSLDNVTKLSLLSAFDKEWREDEKLKSGDVVRRAPSNSASSPFAPPLPAVSNVDVVVVGPNVEQASEAWRVLEKEKRTLEEEIRQQSQKFLPGHEIMKQSQARLKQLEQNLATEADLALTRFDLEYHRVKGRLPELQAEMPEYYATAELYEKFRKDYALMEKGEQDWAAAHNDLSKRLAAMQFGDNKQQTELILGGHELMEDKIPISPTVKKSAMISLALVIALGLGVPLGLDYLNSTVSRLPQLESRLGLTGLGMVPSSSKKLLEEIFRSPAIGSRVPNFLLECFRVIRSNIILHPGKTGQSQVIAITSARPSEGKSTMAANLAWAFFSMGERTLLIDCDLRRGRTHEILALPNTRGISNHFAGEITFEQAIQKTANPNLDVVTRGPFMPGASEYLARSVFEEIVTSMRGKYDRIVLDGPPVLGLSETIALQRVGDGVVLVVRAEDTNIVDVETCVEQLRRADATILGFVLNRLDLSKPSNHYYYYYSSPYYYSAYGDEPLEARSGAIA